MQKTILLSCLIVLGAMISACSKGPGPEQAAAPTEYQKHLQTQLLAACGQARLPVSIHPSDTPPGFGGAAFRVIKADRESVLEATAALG